MYQKDTQKDSDPVLKLKEDVYLEERKLLIDEEREAARTFDKAMLTLSGGALGLSIAFIKNIAPLPRNTGLLFTSWIGFGLALLSTAIALHISQFAFRKSRDLLDANQKKGIDISKLSNCWANLTNLLNWFTIFVFLIGVICLSCFAGINISSIK
jgi:hypothetical protein